MSFKNAKRDAFNGRSPQPVEELVHVPSRVLQAPGGIAPPIASKSLEVTSKLTGTSIL
jgi:hypothetical protein